MESKHATLTLAVLFLLAGQISADPPHWDYKACFHACLPQCKQHQHNWLSWTCRFDCYLTCIPANQPDPPPPPSNVKDSDAADSVCTADCAKSSCLQLDPEETDPAACIADCSKKCA